MIWFLHYWFTQLTTAYLGTTATVTTLTQNVHWYPNEKADFKIPFTPGKVIPYQHVFGSCLQGTGFFECGPDHFLSKIILPSCLDCFKATCANLIYGVKKSCTICEGCGMGRATPSFVSTRNPPAPLNTREDRAMENTNQTLTAAWLLVMYLIHDHHRHGD